MRQVTKLSPANAGVIYINLTAWQELHSDLMRYAELNGWIFPNADQARMHCMLLHTLGVGDTYQQGETVITTCRHIIARCHADAAGLDSFEAPPLPSGTIASKSKPAQPLVG